MNSPTMITKDEQAKKQLVTAVLAQFGEYGMNITTCEVIVQVERNIAAITYYFGLGKGLYLAYARWVTGSAGEQLRPHTEGAERSFA